MYLRSVVFIVLLFIFNSSIIAQEVSIGPRVGINISSVNVDDNSISVNAKTGFTAAGMLEIEFSDHFAIQPEISWTQRNYEASGLGFDRTYKFDYIEIPVLAKIKGGNENVEFYAQAGPSFGYALNASYEVEGGSSIIDLEFDDETQDYTRNEVALHLGGGIGFYAGPGRLILDYRYLLGLTEQKENVDDDQFTRTNRGNLISIGYLLEL